MKKIVEILAVLAAFTLLLSCSKNGVNASIVGTWQAKSIVYSFYDQNGKSVNTKEVITAVYKEMGIMDEQTINSAVQMFENLPVDNVKYEFSSNGTFSIKQLSEDWEGTYGLDGNRLTIRVAGQMETVMTVITLNSQEMKLESTASSVTVLSQAVAEAMEMYERIGYSWRIVSSFSRVQ